MGSYLTTQEQTYERGRRRVVDWKLQRPEAQPDAGAASVRPKVGRPKLHRDAGDRRQSHQLPRRRRLHALQDRRRAR